MTRYRLVMVLLLGSILSATAQEGRGPTESLPWFKDSFLDIREDVAEAAASDRHVILYFHQDGCPYCEKLLRDNFGQQQIAERTQRDFDVIEINLWGDREVTGFTGEETTEKAFAAALKVMYTPTLLMLASNGQVALRINGYYPPHQFNVALDYVAAGKYRQIAFRDYLQEANPPPASGKLHIESYFLQPPYDLRAESSADKPLLVLFEQKQCLDCDQLHQDIFQRSETRGLLDQYRVAVVDMWSQGTVVTPDGQSMPSADWAGQLGIQYAPSLVFFDAEGRELFRSEAYLRAFHVQSVLDYVASGAYVEYPELQRFIQARADAMREAGLEVDLWK
jgi:thioredoxin-related protein